MARRTTGAPRRPRSLPVRILIWLAALLLIILLLSLIFGGFEQGTKVGLNSGNLQRLQSAPKEVTLG